MEKENDEKVDLVQLPSLSVKYVSTKKRNSYNLSSKAETCYFDCIITSQHKKLVA